MAKKKSKELLLAEIAYADGRKDAIGDTHSGDEEEIVRIGAAIALAKWKKSTGGRKPEPTTDDLAFKKWTEEGRPVQGTFYNGIRYKCTAEANCTFSVSYEEGSLFDVAKAGSDGGR